MVHVDVSVLEEVVEDVRADVVGRNLLRLEGLRYVEEMPDVHFAVESVAEVWLADADSKVTKWVLPGVGTLPHHSPGQKGGRNTPVQANTSEGPRILTPQELNQKRSSLIGQGFYLGDDSFDIDSVKWEKGGSENRLVKASSEIRLDAPLSMVLRIKKNDPYVMSCGNWRGPSPTVRKFSDVKISCIGLTPGHRPFEQDYERCIQNLRALMQKAPTNPGGSRGVLLEDGGGTTRIGERGEEGSDNSGIYAPEWPLADWPVASEEAAKALASMAKEATHLIRMLKAYKVDAKLIHPKNYRLDLEDAIVAVHFNLLHWPIAARNGRPAVNTYVADLLKIRVLIPPPPPPPPRAPPQPTPSPLKRRVTLVDSDEEQIDTSPTKKQKGRKDE
ncbi:hypothetical protein H0H92_009144 [Tricholoma furcatifolium]|nr:hypothetical protein H0H92_009144 [Tricholoma furcatifolium]